VRPKIWDAPISNQGRDRLKDKLIAALKAIISLGLMAYFFYIFLSDPNDRAVLVTSFTEARWGYWIVAVGLFLLAIVSNAVKWRILLKAQGVDVPLRAVVNFTFVGQFFTNFLPSNVGGDVMRGWGLARYTDRNADAAVSVVVDRIMGLMAFMFTAVVAALIILQLVARGQGIFESELLVENLIQVQLASILIMVTIVVGFAVLLSHRLRLLFGKLFDIKFLKPLAPIYHQISDAFGAYRHEYRSLLLAFLVALANPLLTGLFDVAIVAGLNAEINPLYIFLFNPIIAVLLIVPISIGGLGAGSALYVYFYGLVGVSAPTAFALSVVKQLVIYLGSIPGAVLWISGPKRSEVEQVAPAKTDSSTI